MDQLHLWNLISSVTLLLKFRNMCMTVAGIQCCPQFYFVVLFLFSWENSVSFFHVCWLVAVMVDLKYYGCLAELAVQWQLTMYFSAPQIIGNFKANYEYLLNKLWTLPQHHKGQTPLKTICMCSIRINEHPFQKQINVKHWNVEIRAVVAEWKAHISSSQSHCLLIQLKVYVKDLGIIFITTR